MSVALRLFQRIMFRNTEAYLLKLAALSIALATSIAIELFSLNEFGYDRFHKDPPYVYRAIQKNVDEHFNDNRLSAKIDTNFIKVLAIQHAHYPVTYRDKIM